ncbi:helix-turn-helix domain-containing protein [Kribbella sp. NPDC050124]|uniref:helix-turn-helix domain-containing protein n=1 Tax=Kribbella sp. NPDC050124 TaxID=3364114 RepID=UPI00379F8B75
MRPAPDPQDFDALDRDLPAGVHRGERAADQLGLAFPVWRRWARLQHALSQVADGTTLTAAAHDSGFADSAHLTRACRAMFGITPSQAITALRQG